MNDHGGNQYEKSENCMPVGDYFIPTIELRPVEDKVLNKYGRMRRAFLQE